MASLYEHMIFTVCLQGFTVREVVSTACILFKIADLN
jgi:hypothetical protein